MIYLIVVVMLLLTTPLAMAQDELTQDELHELLSLDEALFVVGSRLGDDPYAEATKYNHIPVEQRRRGLDWWVVRDLNSRFLLPVEDYEEPLNSGRVRVLGATQRYQYGALVEYGRSFTSGWSLSTKIDFRAGEDVNIDGVFCRDIRPQLTVGHAFSEGHNLKISLEIPSLQRGLQSTATAESMTLTGNNLYNPSWGLYQGEVRNARVSNYEVASGSARYNKEWRETTLTADITANYGRRSVSSLAWYDAYNPTPDYYRKLPSYLADDDLKSEVEQVWRDNDEEYTQIAWDNLVVMNQRSDDGEAHYIIEDDVTRVKDMNLTLLFTQDISSSLSIRYGAAASLSSDRLYKEVVDLLGAQYHLDVDQYIGDYANLGNDMQNNLRDPNRHVLEGERFGYDYTRHSRSAEGLLGLSYLHGSLSVDLNGRFGESRKWREGHYEKERFAGDGSYGDSNIVESATSSLDLLCGYKFGRHNLSLHGAMCRMPQDHRDLFLDEESANRLVEYLDPREVVMLSLGYGFRNSKLNINIEGYYQRYSNQTDVWSGYDDLSYTYSDIVVSGISVRSIGVEAVGAYRVNNRLKFDMTLSLGDYTYDSTPLVQLYDSVDMELFSESQSIATEGCKVGNAPQCIVSGGVDLMVSYGFNLSMNCTYAAGRYVAPSFVRRSERVLRGAGTEELAAEIIEQRSLGSAFDLGMSIMRRFDLRGSQNITLYMRVDNMLGDRNRIDYGRESSRILRGAAYSTTASYYAEADEFRYTRPRTLYLSCSYNW